MANDGTYFMKRSGCITRKPLEWNPLKERSKGEGQVEPGEESWRRKLKEVKRHRGLLKNWPG